MTTHMANEQMHSYAVSTHTYANTFTHYVIGVSGVSAECVFAELEMLVCTGAQVVEGISFCNFLLTLLFYTEVLTPGVDIYF